VFTRRLEDVTKQFPDVVSAVEDQIEAENCIIDAEIVAYDPEDGSMIPFQQLSKRIKRKYKIQKLKNQIPVEVRPFDLLYNEDSRSSILTIVKDGRSSNKLSKKKRKEVRLADRIETSKEQKVQEMQQRSLSEGQEGIMMKALDAKYKQTREPGWIHGKAKAYNGNAGSSNYRRRMGRRP